ncbi:MAG: cell division ATP-binding protein FtsE, partial [Streptosporangiaceae bacterium]
MIHFENVSKAYQNQNRPALENVNIDVEKGEFIFLVGPSGS